MTDEGLRTFKNRWGASGNAINLFYSVFQGHASFIEPDDDRHAEGHPELSRLGMPDRGRAALQAFCLIII